ncbi:TIR domain-containing protein [Lentzea sp. NPDC092896]|uniref:TIR domain-containing protein n=1 Tax=Lentzea sp. NPDC092896 TaxID=3364127 RepID=UPI003808E94C
MKVFLSWAGSETRPFAEFLHEWLQLVIQSVKPWMSERDVAKGSRSMAELSRELDGTQFGIVVLTAANQHSPWINFEAGAISKSVGEASVVPLLLNLKKADVVGPLGQFQAVDAGDRADVGLLLDAINRRLADPLDSVRLGHFVDREWASFEMKLREFRASTPAVNGRERADREVLDEILLMVRDLTRGGVRRSNLVWFEPRFAGRLDELNASDRSVVVLTAIEGLSVREVAATLGIPEDLVRRRLDRARMALQSLEGK